MWSSYLLLCRLTLPFFFISFLHDSVSRMLNTWLTLSLLCFYLSLYIVPWCQWFCTGKETDVTRRRRQDGVVCVWGGWYGYSYHWSYGRIFLWIHSKISVSFLSCGTLESLVHSKPKAFLSLMSLFISIYNTPIWFLWFFLKPVKESHDWYVTWLGSLLIYLPY